MTKKKKRAASNYTKSKQKASRPKKHSKYPLVALSTGVALLAAVIFYFYEGQTQKTPDRETVRAAKSQNIDLREKRPTLSPGLFRGTVRRAYEIAREIPEVLDRLYCYCRCRENFNHINLLTCYTDNHAAT